MHGVKVCQHLRNEDCGSAQHHEPTTPDSAVQVCHHWELKGVFLLLWAQLIKSYHLCLGHVCLHKESLTIRRERRS